MKLKIFNYIFFLLSLKKIKIKIKIILHFKKK
uniref:Uncharacterized protein n=1 Tax=viral metagenome TaxID=1070528 RepID=A0A6C0ADV7_9ZZZZ